MAADKSDPVRALSDRLSDLYVGLEDFTEESSVESLFKVLAILRDLRTAMGTSIDSRSAYLGGMVCSGRRSLQA